jgi:hypothetical protein
MDESVSYMPVIIEATKFLFNEAGKWLDSVRHRIGTSKQDPKELSRRDDPKLTATQFSKLESEPSKLAQLINSYQAESNAYAIRGLVDQLRVHRKNLTDYESTEAEYGVLTPSYVKRSIEREALAIAEKSVLLRKLLEQVYQGSLEDV